MHMHFTPPPRGRPLPGALADLQTVTQRGTIRGRSIVIAKCAVCGRRHVHGLAGERRGSTTSRMAHCRGASDAYLIAIA